MKFTKSILPYLFLVVLIIGFLVFIIRDSHSKYLVEKNKVSSLMSQKAKTLKEFSIMKTTNDSLLSKYIHWRSLYDSLKANPNVETVTITKIDKDTIYVTDKVKEKITGIVIAKDSLHYDFPCSINTDDGDNAKFNFIHNINLSVVVDSLGRFYLPRTSSYYVKDFSLHKVKTIRDLQIGLMGKITIGNGLIYPMIGVNVIKKEMYGGGISFGPGAISVNASYQIYSK